MQAFDVVVIGSGSAGSTVARACARAGRRVAVVDSRPFGGTCALRGCDPKRVLVGAAELVDAAQRLRGKGVLRGEMAIDWPELMRFKRTFTEPVPEQREQEFRELRIAAFHGRARFVNRSVLQVGGEQLEGRQFAICAGAKHRALGIPGEELLATSTDVLDLDALPRRIAFVGGGYVSFELAHLAARAGSQVAIAHGGPRPLEHFDPDLVDRLVAVTRALGVDVRLDSPVEAVVPEGKDVVVRLRGGGEVRCDLAVHGAGRVAELDDLALDAAGIAWSPKGVRVDEHLQSTTHPAVFAAGDAADGGGAPLTPVAGDEGEIVAENLLHGNTRRVDFTGLATMVYTIPALGAVGLTERTAREQGHPIAVKRAETTSWFSSARLAAPASAYMLVTDAHTGRLLGAAVLGPHAEELINLFALALRAGIDASVIRATLFAYPTAASDLEYILSG